MRVDMAHRTPFVKRFFINELVGKSLLGLSVCGTDVCASEQLQGRSATACRAQPAESLAVIDRRYSWNRKRSGLAHGIAANFDC